MPIPTMSTPASAVVSGTAMYVLKLQASCPGQPVAAEPAVRKVHFGRQTPWPVIGAAGFSATQTPGELGSFGSPSQNWIVVASVPGSQLPPEAGGMMHTGLANSVTSTAVNVPW